MAITPLPTPVPNRGMSEEDFATAGDNLLGALPTWTTEVNALAVDVTNKQTAATTAANTATTKATEAATSATTAADWATKTTGTVNGSGDYSAKEYAIGNTVPDGSAKKWATDALSYKNSAEVAAAAAQAAAGLPTLTGNAGKVLTVNGGATGVEWAASVPSLTGKLGQVLTATASGAAWAPAMPAFSRTLLATATQSFTVPDGVSQIRAYAFGRGGNGTTGGVGSYAGGGGGCAFGTINVQAGDTVALTISSGVAKVTHNGIDLLVGNPASGATGGTASKHASVLDGGANSGGNGAGGGVYSGGGGASSGSPVGVGTSGSIGYSGGCGWGGRGQGVGGGAYGASSGGYPGTGYPLQIAMSLSDPLLKLLTGKPQYALLSDSTTAVAWAAAGAPDGCGGISASIFPAAYCQKGGFGGGGASASSSNAVVIGGDGGFGGGGGKGGTGSSSNNVNGGTGGNGGLGGGGGGCGGDGGGGSTVAGAGGTGGAAAIILMY